VILDSELAGARSGQDERDNEAQQGQRFGDGEPEERVGPGQAGRFRLAGRRGDVGGPHNADTDTGADRGKAVTEGADVAGDGSCWKQFAKLPQVMLTWGASPFHEIRPADPGGQSLDTPVRTRCGGGLRT